MRRLLLTSLFLLTFAAPADAAECDRVAAPSGSDAAAGSSEAPLRTAQKLVESLDSGETGCLRAGRYGPTGRYVMRFDDGGVTVRSFPGERAHLGGIVHVPEEASRVRLSGMDFEGNGKMNAIKVYAADFVLEDSFVTTAGRPYSCLMLASGDRTDAPAARPVIRRNTFRMCGSSASGNKDHAIYAEDVVDGRIEDNVIVDPAAYALQLYPNARRMRVARNIVDGGRSVRGGIVIGGEGDRVSEDNVVEHNILAYAATEGVNTHWAERVGAGNVVRENCIWRAKGGLVSRRSGLELAGNLEADPGFLDRAAGDYRLAPGSPCRDFVGEGATAARPVGAPAAKVRRSCRRPRKGASRRARARYRRCVRTR